MFNNMLEKVSGEKEDKRKDKEKEKIWIPHEESNPRLSNFAFRHSVRETL